MRYTPEQVARIAHEANRALQAVNADPAVPVAPPWDQVDPETQASVISGVRGVLDGATPAESHEAWCAFKRRHGWTYGPVKDQDAKTHPCLVDYQDLPAEDQVKDSLFGGIVRALGQAA